MCFIDYAKSFNNVGPKDLVELPGNLEIFEEDIRIRRKKLLAVNYLITDKK